MRRVITTLLAAALLFTLTTPAAFAATPVAGKVIMLDAGHGGYDPGAVNPYNSVAEKWINLAIVHRLKEKLEEDGATVRVTRIGDIFVGLAQRAAIANAARPDVFVSIHHNSTGNPITNGTETYYTHGNSRGLAESLNFFMVKNMDTANRGVRARNLAVTRLTQVPAILTEASFITSNAESSAFINLDRVEQETMGLQQGLLNYFAHH